MEKSQNVGTKSAFTYGLNWLLLKYNDQIDNDCKMILFPQKKKRVMLHPQIILQYFNKLLMWQILTILI